MIAPRFTNIAQIKAANEEADFYWFSPSTIQFFDARVESRIYDDGKGHRLWVDSIQDHGRDYVVPRQYKIAQFDVATSDIDRPKTDPDEWASVDEAELYLTRNLI